MAKSLKKGQEEAAPLEKIEAVCIIRSSEITCRTFRLMIEDGRVVSSEELTRARDVPAIAIGHAVNRLWAQYRNNRTSFEKPGMLE